IVRSIVRHTRRSKTTGTTRTRMTTTVTKRRIPVTDAELSRAATLDVSSLPATVFDTKAPLWWGNTLLLCIETAMFGILVALYFKWNDNAYGSVTWMILGMHMLHLFVMLSEDAYLLLWSFIKGVDDKHAVDLTVTAIYWYWIVGIWLPLYFLIYIVPRIA